MADVAVDLIGRWRRALEAGPGPRVAPAPSRNGAGARARSEPAVEVAVDAPGASRTYNYSVPARFDPDRGRRGGAGRVRPGPAGPRRRSRAPGAPEPSRAIELKPILARVRADGPLLPPLTLEFARWISEEYLAPPAATLRSMLPPGMLERLELVAEWLPDHAGGEGGDDGRAEGADADGAAAAVDGRCARTWRGPAGDAVRDLRAAGGRLDGRRSATRWQAAAETAARHGRPRPRSGSSGH